MRLGGKILRIEEPWILRLALALTRRRGLFFRHGLGFVLEARAAAAVVNAMLGVTPADLAPGRNLEGVAGVMFGHD